jgi:hypothetical protein
MTNTEEYAALKEFLTDPDAFRIGRKAFQEKAKRALDLAKELGFTEDIPTWQGMLNQQ